MHHLPLQRCAKHMRKVESSPLNSSPRPCDLIDMWFPARHPMATAAISNISIFNGWSSLHPMRLPCAAANQQTSGGGRGPIYREVNEVNMVNMVLIRPWKHSWRLHAPTCHSS